MHQVPEFPLRIFFDGACAVCSREIEHYRLKDRNSRLVPIDISTPDFDPRQYGIPLQAFMHELHAIDRHGKVYRGVDAFRAIWQAFPGSGLYRALAVIVALPVVAPLARFGYWGFARMRPYLPGRRSACPDGRCRIGRNRAPATKGEGKRTK